jgi:hypothetical protein
MKLYHGNDSSGNFWIYPLIKVGNFTHLVIYIDEASKKDFVSLTSVDESSFKLYTLKEKKLKKEYQRKMVEKIMNGELTREMSLYR